MLKDIANPRRSSPWASLLSHCERAGVYVQPASGVVQAALWAKIELNEQALKVNPSGPVSSVNTFSTSDIDPPGGPAQCETDLFTGKRARPEIACGGEQGVDLHALQRAVGLRGVITGTRGIGRFWII